MSVAKTILITGTSGFIGEFLILVGIFQKSALVAILASLGVILAASYMLWLYGRVIFGKLNSPEIKKIIDLTKSETYIFGSLIFLILYFGFYPEPLLNTIDISINNLIDKYESEINLNLEPKVN